MTADDASNPQPCDIVITGGRILDLDAPGGVIDGHDVVIVGSMIAAVTPTDSRSTRWNAKRVVDARNHIVAPGFVDAHVHLGALLGAGRPYTSATGPGLFSGANRIVEIGAMMAQLMAIPVPAPLMTAVARPAFGAMLLSGITSVVDAGSSGHEGLITAALETGIRSSIGPALSDTALDSGGALSRTADHVALLDAARAFVEAHRGRATVQPIVAAADTQSCSDELLAGIADLTSELDIPTHVHSHISPASRHEHNRSWGRTETERLNTAGLLTRRCTAMHVAEISEEDIETLRVTGTTVNHNALGNAMLGFGVASQRSVRRLLDAHVPIVLGSDYSPSMIATPLDMMRVALAVHREIGAADDALRLEEALAMATNPGVSVGQPERLGRIASGQLADIVLIDTTGPHHLGSRHPIPAITLRARPSDISTVIVNGEVVVKSGRLTRVDEATIAAEADAAFAQIDGFTAKHG